MIKYVFLKYYIGYCVENRLVKDRRRSRKIIQEVVRLIFVRYDGGLGMVVGKVYIVWQVIVGRNMFGDVRFYVYFKCRIYIDVYFVKCSVDIVQVFKCFQIDKNMEDLKYVGEIRNG